MEQRGTESYWIFRRDWKVQGNRNGVKLEVRLIIKRVVEYPWVIGRYLEWICLDTSGEFKRNEWGVVEYLDEKWEFRGRIKQSCWRAREDCGWFIKRSVGIKGITSREFREDEYSSCCSAR